MVDLHDREYRAFSLQLYVRRWAVKFNHHTLLSPTRTPLHFPLIFMHRTHAAAHGTALVRWLWLPKREAEPGPSRSPVRCTSPPRPRNAGVRGVRAAQATAHTTAKQGAKVQAPPQHAHTGLPLYIKE